MKYKILIILLLFLSSINLVLAAGQVQNIEFNEFPSEQIITISENDRVDFDLAEGTHTIIIDRIYANKSQVELDVFRYIDRKVEDRMPVGYVTIHTGEVAKLDLNMDKYNDLLIKIINVNKDETKISFTAVHECIFTDPETCKKNNQKEEDKEPQENLLDKLKNINKTGLIITLSIIIMGLILFFTFKKSKP